jgi:F0F1-type ATP synthase membrane subunit b/b'
MIFSVANRRTMLLMIGILAFALVCVMCRRTEGFMRRRPRWLSKGKKIENTSDELTEEDRRQRREDKRQRQTDRRQNKKDRQLERTDRKLKREDIRQQKVDKRQNKMDRQFKRVDTQIKTQIGDLKRADKKLKKQIKEKTTRGTILALKDRITQLENPTNYNPA